MSHQRWQQLALITVALCCAAAGAALRVAHAPDPVATLAWIALGGIFGVPVIWWRVHREQDAALAEAMHTHGALGGVPCALPLDTPAWGSLVLTETAWVWEPNQRAAARGQRQVHIDGRAVSPVFGKVRVGVRDWPSATLTDSHGAALTVVMSSRSAERLSQLNSHAT